MTYSLDRPLPLTLKSGNNHHSESPGRNPAEYPRSRYTGAVVFDDEMVISIAVSENSPIVGHAHVVLEAAASGKLQHQIFHLVKSENQSSSHFALSVETGVIKQNPAIDYFVEDQHGNAKKFRTHVRSWKVRAAMGQQALDYACAAEKDPPSFSLVLARKGKNCSKWALEVAGKAGIDLKMVVSGNGRYEQLVQRLGDWQRPIPPKLLVGPKWQLVSART